MSPSGLAEYGGANISRAWTTGNVPSAYPQMEQWDTKSFKMFPPTVLRTRGKRWLSPSEESIPATVSEQMRKRQKRSDPLTSTNLHEDLILGYMAGRHIDDHGCQPRRTLDQYKYSHLGSIGERDGDQVVYRYTKEKQQEPKIFMVDQLWYTLVTCAPLQWDAMLTEKSPESQLEEAPAQPHHTLR
ncbi:26S proteasome non-ATPase regulatory subunit 10 [Akanthomyces lecanii RCEF 1005]|uniref:26S proteasome non-ATPase regulatory subunit 10 n=1 Tax=Akanthomyces lecanii RCEF 1005 TaxID=1081108 RepID=A0A168BC05_CORDF|nr:26S proteasome non-ATPase regulatory subunit 10 [Akanthomyces lecanii RCEF 1005]